MSDEPKALNDTAEEPVSPPEPPTEEPKATEEVTEPEVETDLQPDETEGEETETGESSKKGYSQRVRELAREKNEYKERVKSLEERVAELTGNSNQVPNIQPLTDEPIIKPGEEIDAIELDKRLRAREQKIIQHADSISQLRGIQQDTVSRLQRETDQVLKKYPELDPDSENFDKELSETVTEAIEAHIKAAPYSASVLKFTDKLMKPYQKAVTREVGKASEAIAKQVSQTAQRPTSVSKSEKSPKEKSIAELEQELGIVQA